MSPHAHRPPAAAITPRDTPHNLTPSRVEECPCPPPLSSPAAGSPRSPGATYRLQLHAGYGFAAARELVDYLSALGVTDLYLSPVLTTRPGSSHGYDVTDPTRINPALGGEEEFVRLVRALQEKEMGLLLDIVPNHMAATYANPWWRDVLEKGPASPYASYFDINWHPPRPEMAGQILVPVLGRPYGRVLEDGELALGLDAAGFSISYYAHRLPLRPASCYRILANQREALARDLGPHHPAVRELTALVEALAEISPADAEGSSRWKARLWQLAQTYPEIKTSLDVTLRRYNGRQGDPKSFDLLDALVAEQHWRPAWWRAASQEINYRRFFDISDLVALRMEEEPVFTAVHQKILELARAGLVTGLRVDHIDGLDDPQAYLSRLQESLGGNFYVVVEKILGGEEELPPTWPVAGTTGYDFLHLVNSLLVNPQGMEILAAFYHQVTNDQAGFDEVVYQQKRRVIAELFAGEFYSLACQLGRLAAADRHGRDLTLADLEEALVEVTAGLPVYRTYIRSLLVPEPDRGYIERAFTATAPRPPGGNPARDFLRRVLQLDFPPYLDPAQQKEWLRFVKRWQQFTGAVMAKGLEDTALYRYNQLISLNEVGSRPGRMAFSLEQFHRANMARQEYWPHTLNATSTHDTKRSEDVRASINVLSEIPDLWAAALQRWRMQNAIRKTKVQGKAIPDGNMELFLYQTLVGAWPLAAEEIPAFRERLAKYLVKAAREAKAFTSWLDPQPAYEKGLVEFAMAILEPGPENAFLEDFLAFQQVTARYAALNSLAQVLLKVTSPGVPDFYQGTELWDFSLVDPDNRRPVDFTKRKRLLAALQEGGATSRLSLARELVSSWQDGRIKMYVTYQTLHYRREHQELFTAGGYLPLEAAGKAAEHACAFCRRHEDTWVLVAVPRFTARLARSLDNRSHPHDEKEAALLLSPACWADTSLVLPDAAPLSWKNIFTGENMTAAPSGSQTRGLLPLSFLFCNFPVALLTGKYLQFPSPGLVPYLEHG